jgi:hypothetical protein
MKTLWKSLEIGVWIFAMGALAFIMVSLQLNIAEQNKMIFKVQQEIENLTQKTQKSSSQKYMNSIKIVV